MTLQATTLVTEVAMASASGTATSIGTISAGWDAIEGRLNPRAADPSHFNVYLRSMIGLSELIRFDAGKVGRTDRGTSTPKVLFISEPTICGTTTLQ
jgi:hypothetical protein